MLLIDVVAIFGLAIIRKLMGGYFGTISSGFIGFFGVKGVFYSFLHVTGYAHNNAEIQETYLVRRVVGRVSTRLT
jgi:hypothetical protein